MVGLVLVVLAPSAPATPGELDSTFGVGGVLTTNFGGTYDWAYAGARQPDDRILAAGVSNAHGTYDFALARYTADRSLDPSFGEGGMVTTDFGDGSYDDAYALLRQPDGRIVLGGYSTSAGGPGVLFGADQLALARYTPEGLPDMGFGRQGKVVVDAGSLDEEIRALALTPRGAIVAAGFANGERGGDVLVARFTPEGGVDQTFGDGGLTISDLSPYSEGLAALALQPDGRIVAAGDVARAREALADFAVVRYDPDGHLETSFGSGGVATADFAGRQDKVGALILQPNGKLVTVGSSEHDFAVARFNGS